MTRGRWAFFSGKPEKRDRDYWAGLIACHLIGQPDRQAVRALPLEVRRQVGYTIREFVRDSGWVEIAVCMSEIVESECRRLE